MLPVRSGNSQPASQQATWAAAKVKWKMKHLTTTKSNDDKTLIPESPLAVGWMEGWATSLNEDYDNNKRQHILQRQKVSRWHPTGHNNMKFHHLISPSLRSLAVLLVLFLPQDGYSCCCCYAPLRAIFINTVVMILHGLQCQLNVTS